MRQRLSSEPDRYRGRRRVPTPPRSRYAVVVASAFVGAGVVAIGAASALPDVKAVDPELLAGLDKSSVSADALAQRAEDTADRSARGAGDSAAAEVREENVWLLPLDDYTFTSPYGVRWGKLHAGIDLSAPEGTPFKAIHAGVVTKAGYNGGYGYAVTVRQPDGTETIYGHARRVHVRKGQHVKAGDKLGEVGSTGYSYGTHLHLETHVNGRPADPIRLLRQRGVDIKLKVEAVYGGLADAS